jgi:hypothetical protein
MGFPIALEHPKDNCRGYRVPTSEKTITTPTFDIVHQIRRILQDPVLFNPANVILNKDDPFAPYEPNDSISNIQDGAAYQATEKEIRARPENQGILILIACLKFYIDKTHTDLMGKYTGEPLLAVFTFLTLACQGQVDFQIFLGMVADMDRKSSAVKQTLETGAPCRNYHNQLHVILQALTRIQERGGIWMKIVWNGVVRNVKVIPTFLLLTGDSGQVLTIRG